MSMNSFPINIVGLLIDQELAAYCWKTIETKTHSVPKKIKIMSREDFISAAKAGTLPDDYGSPMELHEEDVGHFCSGFDGNIKTIFPERAIVPIEMDTDDECIAYIKTDKAADLFSAAYESPEALLQSFKDSLSWADIPEDFDWWAHLVEISGTTFC